MSENLEKYNQSRAEKDLAAIINNDETLLDTIPKSRMEELLIMLFNKCKSQEDEITELNGKLTNKCAPSTSTYSDGRNIIGCLDDNNNGFSIILASDYIRFDFISNGSATKNVRYSIKQV